MTYVMSDLHGEVERYRMMLELIGFSDRDILYILGDIVDRGKRSSEIWLDVMKRKNVFVLKGNHEVMAERHLKYLFEVYGDRPVNVPDLYSDPGIRLWFQNGGDTTVSSLYEQSAEDRRRIYDYICNLPFYKTIEVRGRNYVLVHAGLGDHPAGTLPEEVSERELVWSRPDFGKRHFEDEGWSLIVGHTPTFLLRSEKEPATIYRRCGADIIAIDCGAAYPELCGRLGCLRLEDGKEFYV